MRVGRLLECYEVRVVGEGPTAVVAELWHVAPNAAGGAVHTPVGHLAAAPRPAQPEAAAHWAAELFVRADVAPPLRDPRLPAAVADWLLRETAAREPCLVHVYAGRSTDFVLRGQIWSED